jgi:hypothetical protein
MLRVNNRYRNFRQIELSLCTNKLMWIRDPEGNINEKVVVVSARAVKEPLLAQVYTLDGEERFFGMESLYERD